MFNSLWPVAYTVQKFSRPEYWVDRLSFPGNLPNPGIEPKFHTLQKRVFTSWELLEPVSENTNYRVEFGGHPFFFFSIHIKEWNLKYCLISLHVWKWLFYWWAFWSMVSNRFNYLYVLFSLMASQGNFGLPGGSV